MCTVTNMATVRNTVGMFDGFKVGIICIEIIYSSGNEKTVSPESASHPGFHILSSCILCGACRSIKSSVLPH